MIDQPAKSSYGHSSLCCPSLAHYFTQLYLIHLVPIALKTELLEAHSAITQIEQFRPANAVNGVADEGRSTE
jgi:hypothetical protein